MPNKVRPIIDDSNGNVGISTLGVPTSKLQVGGHITPDLNVTYSLGLPNAYWSSSFIHQHVGNIITASVAINAKHIAANTVSAAGGITSSNMMFFSASAPPRAESRMFYDWAEHSVAYYTDVADLTVNVGQENVVRVYNPGTALLPGVPVYISASNTMGVPRIYPAIADASSSLYWGDVPRWNVIGVTSHFISGSAYGYVKSNGVIRGLNLNYPEGTMLWLSTTESGSFQVEPPVSLYQKFFVGWIVQSGSATGTDLLVALNPHSYGATSASYAGTASFLNPATPSYGITSSFHPTASLTQGSLLLWVLPGSGSYMDSAGQYPSDQRGQPIRFMRDLSGLGRNVWTPPGTMTAYMKYMYITNVGGQNNKPAIWVEGVNGSGLQSAAIATPTYPLWLFVVAKMATGSVATATVFDGIESSNRFLCQVGTTVQIYSGTSMTGNVTGSLTGSIQNRWFLQSFKNTAGGVNSYVKTNGTQSVIGNCGEQTITGYTIASDYLGNNGGVGVSIAELILASNITDADAANIETYLKSKHDLFY